MYISVFSFEKLKSKKDRNDKAKICFRILRLHFPTMF